MDPRAELESIIRDAWAIHKQSGDERDAALARAIEADARALMATLPQKRDKRKKSNAALKRRALKHCVRLDASLPIFQQVRTLVR